MQMKNIKKKFQFDLGVIFQPMKILGKTIYCFKFSDDYSDKSIYYFTKVFKKLGYHMDKVERIKFGNYPEAIRYYKGISINQDTKQFWFYKNNDDCTKLFNDRYGFDRYNRAWIGGKIYDEQPNLLIRDIGLDFTYYRTDNRFCKTNELPDYLLQYEMTLFEKIKEWWLYF